MTASSRRAVVAATGEQTYGIGVNLTWLMPGVVGGSEEYTMRLLQAVHDHLDPRIHLRIYGRSELFEAYPDLSDQYSVAVMPQVGIPGGGSRPGRVLMEQTWLAAVSGGDAAMHHAGGTIPYVRRQPAVVTVHDPQPLEFPEYFHPIKRRWLHQIIPYSVRAARLVLCPSRFTANRLRELLDVPEEKLRVVVHGHRADGETTDGETAGLQVDRFGRYLLYPAIAYPHKRHIDVVRALAELGSESGDVAAVFTGRPGPELEAVVAEAARLGVQERVHVLGRVPRADLEALYRSAQALVFPSAYEGFGNPALEAMSARCPVVVSDAGALPDVVGEAGVVVPVGDVGAIARSVEKLMADQTLADEFRRRGVARAADFDLGIAAAQLADVYGELAESRRS